MATVIQLSPEPAPKKSQLEWLAEAFGNYLRDLANSRDLESDPEASAEAERASQVMEHLAAATEGLGGPGQDGECVGYEEHLDTALATARGEVG